MGITGGTALGAMRYLSSLNRKTAFTWGAVVGGLLYGSNWYVCRRAMYAAIQQEAQLLQRVQSGDVEAMEEYRRIMEERQRARAPTAREAEV